MPPAPHLQTLIAHYLASNYPSVLPAFLSAAHLAEPGVAQPPRPDLQSLVTEFYAHQASIDLASTTLDDAERVYDGDWAGWTAKQVMRIEMRDDVKLGGVRRTLEGISATNLLTVGVVKVPRRTFDTTIAGWVVII